MVKKVLNVLLVIAVCAIIISLFFVENIAIWFCSIFISVFICGIATIVLFGLVEALFPIVRTDNDYAKIVITLTYIAAAIGAILLTLYIYENWF